MKAVAVFSLFALTFAADHVPVTIENQDPSFDVNCGKTAISGRDIYNAAAWGMSLNQSSETRQGKSRTFRLSSIDTPSCSNCVSKPIPPLLWQQ